MNAILLLSAALAGQSPTHAPPAVPSRPAHTQPVIAPRYVIQTYKIHHEGLTFYVRGYYRPDIQRIVWNEDDEVNAGSYSVALVSQATFGFEQDGTSPGLVNRPLVASRPAYSPKERTSVIGMQPTRSRAPSSLRNSRN